MIRRPRTSTLFPSTPLFRSQKAGDAARRQQEERPAARDERRAEPEEEDLSDDALAPQRADDRVGKAELAPIKRGKPVIELVARLQRGGAGDKEPEPPVGGEPAAIRIRRRCTRRHGADGSRRQQ